ncbi:hypothetical protein K0B96_02760 [Horticoccus luteus]|uniref:Uncharacterized protein n=1 Tax=Horticoccus luteus TaxID=2862869 RepID=A0A8F9XHP4_9BACT|nr:hypothetical protein [Horticoccus luteus]QYM79555.1 hypothetical protein K0B96_02760 [Horticoccus luteus]
MSPCRSSPFPRHPRRGSAFVTVMIFVIILFGLSASILSWSLTESRLNRRNSYWLEARNAAEAVAEFGFSQIVNQFNSFATPPTFDPGGANALVLPPDSFFRSGSVRTGTYSATNPNGLELVGGVLVTIPSSGALFFVDPNNPDNQFDTLKGQYVYRRDVQVLARASVVPPIGAPITAYVSEKISIRGAPLFAHAIFYDNNDLEAAPGPTLDIYGPVHVNGNMFPLAQGTVETGSANAVNFHGPVSVTGHIYHSWASEKPAAQGRGYSSSSGTLDGEPLGNDPITFVNSTGSQVNLKDSSGVWKDSTMGGLSSLLSSQGRFTNTTTPAITQLEGKLSSNFRQYASQTWGGNLQTSAMGVSNYHPISFGQPVDDSGTLPDPHAIIDRPDSGLTTGSAYYDARAEVENQKFANQTGLYVEVKVTPGTGGSADSATVTLFGPRNSAPSGTAATDIGPNGGIRLGAVPSNLVTFVPYLATGTGTSTQKGNQVSYSSVKITSGTYKNKYQIQKTTKTGGTISNNVTVSLNGTGGSGQSVNSSSFSGGSSSTTTVNPSTYYNSSSAADSVIATFGDDGVTATTDPSDPNVSASSMTVQSGFYDQRQLTGINVVQVNLGALRSALKNTLTNTNTDGAAIKTASGAIWGTGASGWNGGVYVDVKSTAGSDFPGQTSVVLANATVASGSSLLPTVNSVTGVTLATNAPAYILGHFNADGNNATSATSATMPDDGKTGAAGSGDSAEIPVAIAADAITILSPNYFGTNSTTNLVPTSNGSTSAGKSYSTVSPSASGSTEVAAAFITGIAPTSPTSFSGGVHNLPRFIENWGSNAVAIRGSLVSLYKSNVSTQPWAQRYYSAPRRIWGFDKIFENGHFPPLTPKVMSYRRVDFTDLSAADYNAARHALWPARY